MAKITSKTNSLEERYREAEEKQEKGSFTCVISILAAALLAVLSMFFPQATKLIWWFLIPAAGVIFIVGLVNIGLHSGHEMEIMRNGVEGEQNTHRLLEQLPDSYRGYRNVVVPFEGKESELDMVITGPTGVFIIETKHLNGTVCGDYGSEQWELQKVGRQGGLYSKALYSPVKQVRTHTFRLAGYLRNQGCGTFVKDMVYFSSPETELELTGDSSRTPAFAYTEDGGKGLLHYITSQPTNIPPHVLKRINQSLERL